MKHRTVETLVLLTFLAAPLAWADQKVTVHVKGMVCDFCVRGLTKGFNVFKESAVLTDFKVDLSKHIVTMEVKDGASITDAEITRVVENSSLAVDKIDR